MRRFTCYTISFTLSCPPDDEDEMGSGVIMAEGDDDMEVNGPEDAPPNEEEDEELEPASDEDGGEIFDTDSLLLS